MLPGYRMCFSLLKQLLFRKFRHTNLDLNGTMSNSPKRSYETEELLGLEEASTVMGITVDSIRKYAQRGLVRLVKDKDKPALVSLSDLGALAGLIARKFDFARIASLAMRAWVSAVRAERRLVRLEELLGVESRVLEISEEAIVSFHRECLDLIAEYTQDMSAVDVLDWAYRLANITEEYLEAVRMFVGVDEPWTVFADAAQKLYDAAPRKLFNHRRDLEIAYSYVAAARRHIRQVAYFYIRSNHGLRIANKAFPEMNVSERDDRVIKLLFMMRKK
jgi:hypothetical protein